MQSPLMTDEEKEVYLLLCGWTKVFGRNIGLYNPPQIVLEKLGYNLNNTERHSWFLTQAYNCQMKYGS